ncbi:site-specific integrase [Prevotella sp. kh1p2]|uniref:site-specific integrase n=1 Tax=Prevotella sp. kh1p2 TaxID=1761883 RepID=UPI0008C34DFD|nr:site-specific integrase [Prevotella sp. kh1p2]SES81217.1 Phage integrase SAM-like domain-containing protein [Prevotella sp. kh1p2]SNU10757.1 Phage integrase SAM-like domain-containing protein [Prevotellaceae bacterium KH2P17]
MAKLFLRTTKTKGYAPLYMRLTIKGVNTWLNTHIEVSIPDWKTSEGEKVVSKIERVRDMLNSLSNDVLNDKQAVDDAVRDIVFGEQYRAVKAAEKRRERSLIGFCDYFINGIADGSIKHKDKSYSKSSIRIWGQFLELLKAYLHDDEAVTFDDVTKPFADKFSAYLERRGMMASTVNKYVICFRKLCNRAAEEGRNSNAVSLRVWHERAVSGSEKRTETYMTDEELDALYRMPLVGKKKLVRDLFFIGCVSCQRFSDYGFLGKDNFIRDSDLLILRLTQQKTGTYVEVPIVDERAVKICNDYNFDFPTVSGQQINRYIKEVLCDLAKLVPSLREKQVTVLTYAERRSEENYKRLLAKSKEGKKLIRNEADQLRHLQEYAEMHNGSPLFERNAAGKVIRPKYELITSHTARRSGLTNAYKTGLFDTRELMSLSGHQSERVFEHYIRVGTREQAKRIAAKVAEKEELKENKTI